MRSALFLLCVLSIGLAACTADDGEDRAAVRQALLADLANRVIEPAHAQFAADADALETAVADFATEPSAAALDAARAAWTEAARSFHRLAALNLPGVRFGLYHNRIATWPADTEEIEARIDVGETIDLAYVESLGSNVRGLPGLEYLLFADGALDAMADAQRRAYVVAVAEDISAQAEALLEKWRRDGGGELGMFEAADTEGRSLQSSVSRIVNEMAMVAEDLRYQKVGRPLGIARAPNESGEPRPDLVESPYAEASLALFRADLAGLRALVTADDGTGLDDYLATLDADVDGQPFGEVLLAQIDATDTAAAAITPSLRQAIASDPESVRALYDETGDLLRLIKTDLANWLGVSITFSDNDGD